MVPSGKVTPDSGRGTPVSGTVVPVSGNAVVSAEAIPAGSLEGLDPGLEGVDPVTVSVLGQRDVHRGGADSDRETGQDEGDDRPLLQRAVELGEPATLAVETGRQIDRLPLLGGRDSSVRTGRARRNSAWRNRLALGSLRRLGSGLNRLGLTRNGLALAPGRGRWPFLRGRGRRLRAAGLRRRRRLRTALGAVYRHIGCAALTGRIAHQGSIYPSRNPAVQYCVRWNLSATHRPGAPSPSHINPRRKTSHA